MNSTNFNAVEHSGEITSNVADVVERNKLLEQQVCFCVSEKRSCCMILSDKIHL